MSLLGWLFRLEMRRFDEERFKKYFLNIINSIKFYHFTDPMCGSEEHELFAKEYGKTYNLKIKMTSEGICYWRIWV
jgi:phage anti-repressor protein